MQAQERVIKRAKRCIMFGVIIGMASVFILVFNIWHGPTSFDPAGTKDALNRIMLVVFASSALGVAAYRSCTEDVRSLLRKSEDLANGVDLEGGESPAVIVGKAREYQADFIETSQGSRRFSRKFAWLSVNRSCDLNCSFCYANRRGPDEEMPLDVFEGIVEAVQGLGVDCVHLTGGDASGYSHLIDAIGIARSYGMQIVMPTNGLKYASLAHAFALARAGISQVNVSLKGWDRNSYLNNTGVDGFDLAMEAIRNLKQAGVEVAVSMVLYADSVPDFLQGVKAAQMNGVSAFEFSPAFESQELPCAQMPPDQAHRFVRDFSAAYDKLVEITDGNFILSQTLPLCMWDETLIRKMNDNHQLSSVCQLFDESGIVFDNRGRLLMCNAFHAYPIGTYGKDFADSGALHGLIMGDKAQAARKRLCSPPSERCATCKIYSKCAGGCATRWTKFDFKEFEPYLHPVL